MNNVLDNVEEEVLELEQERKDKVSANRSLSVDDRITEMLVYYKPGLNRRRLPSGVAGLHGCMNCPWLDTVECPELDCNAKTRIPIKQMCDKKEYWLKLFSRKDVYRNYTEWNRDYNLGMLNKEILRDYHKISSLAIKLSNEDISDKERRRLELELKILRKEWKGDIIELIKLDDKQVERDTPKQLDIKNVKTMDLTSMNNIIRGTDTVIDVEVEEE